MASRTGAPSNMPAEPYTWNESVMSTRSLSYVSTMSAIGHSGRPMDYSRNPSVISSTWRQSEAEIEDDDHTERELLPMSVENSPLFLLPRELREKVYQYCLMVEDKPVVEWPTASQYELGIYPQLLLTCKAVHEEATPLLYSQNVFGFGHPTDANIFVRCMVSQAHASLISRLNLHVRTQDTRLWMSYLSSNDKRRSLRHDFPNLQELTIQYRSVRWSSQASLDHNMRLWSEDRHLDELIIGLRHAYYDPYKNLNVEGLTEEQLSTLRSYEEADYEMQDALRDLKVREKLREIRQIQEERLRERRAPRIRVICMCRVPLAHFQALTAQATHLSTAPAPPPVLNGVQLAHQMLFQQDPATRRATTPPNPVEEGDEYSGFTQVDLRKRARRLSARHFPGGAAAWVAKTVFLNRKNIMLALEIFTFENV